MGISPLNLYSSFMPSSVTALQSKPLVELPVERNPELWSACQDFEALLLQQMLRAMSSTLTSGSMFGAVAGSGIYQELFETELAKSMSRSGGVGLAEILYKQMSRDLESRI